MSDEERPEAGDGGSPDAGNGAGDEGEAPPRRAVLGWALAGTGLTLGYLTGLFPFLRFLIPSGSAPRRPMFIGTTARFPPGSSRTIRDPEGLRIIVQRGPEGEFRAFSARCPHLGCMVRREDVDLELDGRRVRGSFFCPCHIGVFDEDGQAIAGPPRGSLERFPIEVRGRSVFLMVRERRA